MSTLDYHTTGIDDEHMTASAPVDGKPSSRKQQSMLLITVIIDGLIAIIALITEIICCAHMIISMIHAEATMTSVEGFPDTIHHHSNRELYQIGNWINMIMDMTCPME